MFTRVFALLPLALLVSASHLEARDQCTSGQMSCCNSVQTYSESTNILGSVGLLDSAIDPNSLVGFNCSPLSGVGVGGNSCTKQTVCCTDNKFNGGVNLGCTPINANA